MWVKHVILENKKNMFSRHPRSRKYEQNASFKSLTASMVEIKSVVKKHIFKTPKSHNYEQNAFFKSVTASMVKIKSVGQYGNKCPRESLG